ncbi:hypothetical protein GCM10010992_19350 [Cloacibacterium rupense]|uniref:Uncharacterized protein n=1 Tax=Cloacibacterium rupense TaxID=517423 RepID=A0ABQ2NJJ3_9FLAO|nr:hypothetical protein [Cloacibacterium rupense]GGP04979.1 hypothetical protein GCM10010992_19350 [Cloacibacterium rupense]
MTKEELLEIESKAHNEINDFVNGKDDFLFEVTKLENGYELKNKNKDYYYQITNIGYKWLLVVIMEKEYRFDGSALINNMQRHYDGWNGYLDEKIKED